MLFNEHPVRVAGTASLATQVVYLLVQWKPMPGHRTRGRQSSSIQRQTTTTNTAGLQNSAGSAWLTGRAAARDTRFPAIARPPLRPDDFGLYGALPLLLSEVGLLVGLSIQALEDAEGGVFATGFFVLCARGLSEPKTCKSSTGKRKREHSATKAPAVAP